MPDLYEILYRMNFLTLFLRILTKHSIIVFFRDSYNENFDVTKVSKKMFRYNYQKRIIYSKYGVYIYFFLGRERFGIKRFQISRFDCNTVY